MRRRGFLKGLLGLLAAPAAAKALPALPPPVEPALLRGELGVVEGLTFYEQPVVIDQMRGVAERELNPFQEAWAQWFAEEMDKAMYVVLTGGRLE